MFKFLQRTPASEQPAAAPAQTEVSPTDVAANEASASPEKAPDATPANVHDLAVARAALLPPPGVSRSIDDHPPDVEPWRGVLGLDAARAALRPLTTARPRSAFFIAAPASADHDAALQTLIREAARALPVTDAVVLVGTFGPGGSGTGGIRDIALPRGEALAFAGSVADAVEMLSVTLPAAFASDSVQVAMLALDEELRSSHDQALDALKRKAQAQNIGLLRTPQGYAVAPLHDGRIVASDVFKALPESLKAEVENKLQTFETELGAVLANRAVLQQDHSVRRRDLSAEIAGLAVRAALSKVTAAFKSHPAVTGYLDALRADLIANAALFLTAARTADGQPRSPAELSRDPRLARYAVAVLPAAQPDPVAFPDGLERADLCGELRPMSHDAAAVPSAIRAGALTMAARGFLVIEARDLLSQYAAWPILKQALKSGSAIPADRASATGRAYGVTVPVEATLIVVGEPDDYRTWCHMDRDVTRLVRLIRAFDATVPLTPDVERAFSGLIAGCVADDGLLPLDATAIASLQHDRTTSVAGVSHLSTDTDALRDLIATASQSVRAAGRDTVRAADVLAAVQRRDDRTAQTERGART